MNEQDSDFAKVSRPLLQLVQRLTGLETTFVTRIDWGAQVQEIVVARNTTADLVVPEGTCTDWPETTCRRMMSSGKQLSSDVGGDFPGSIAAERLGMQTYLALPILGDADRVLGTVCGASRRKMPQDAETLERVRLIAEALAIQMRAHIDAHAAHAQAEDLARTVESLEALAMTDALTGLRNRRAFISRWEEELARSGRHGHPIALLQLDVDDFKLVNDTHGHSAGDEVLIRVAGILQKLARAADIPARIGGDEFVVAMPHADASGATSLARRIADELAVVWPGPASPCTLSIGISSSTYTPRHDLFVAADEALYRAKRQGRNRFEVWEGDISVSRPDLLARAR